MEKPITVKLSNDLDIQIPITGAPVDLIIPQPDGSELKIQFEHQHEHQEHQQSSSQQQDQSTLLLNMPDTKTTSVDITKIEINTENKREDSPFVETTKTVIIKTNTIETSYEHKSGEVGESKKPLGEKWDVQVEPSQINQALLDSALAEVKRPVEVIEFNFPERPKVAVSTEPAKTSVSVPIKVDTTKKDGRLNF